MAAPVAVGVAVGDPAAGLMATIGAFTALYGSGRPYVYRAAMLALIAAGFSLAVGFGIAAASTPIGGVIAVCAIAMTATLLCRALNTGPPGAYLFALACAVGTALPAAHITAAHAALLVGAGGAFSWLAHMAGALVRFRGPETTSVLLAARAVGALVRAAGTPAQDGARHRAALALHDAWSALIAYQPLHRKTDDRVARLRQLNRELHLLYADALAHASRHEAMPPQALEQVRAIAAQVRDPSDVVPAQRDELPLGRPGVIDSLRESLARGSMARLVVMRVGVASIIAGILGSMLALHHAYWSIAAAVLVLHYGFGWRRTVRRGLERLIGTWAGLAVAGALLLWSPQGWALVAAVAALQFVIEMLVLRNYAWGVVFITAIALLIAAGGKPVASLGDLLLSRGIDTTLGCVIGILVFALLRPGAAARMLRERLEAIADPLTRVAARLAAGDVVSLGARLDRRALQHALFGLAEAYEGSVGGTPRERAEAEALWPDVADKQREGYRLLSECWKRERAPAG